MKSHGHVQDQHQQRRGTEYSLLAGPRAADPNHANFHFMKQGSRIEVLNASQLEPIRNGYHGCCLADLFSLEKVAGRTGAEVYFTVRHGLPSQPKIAVDFSRSDLGVQFPALGRRGGLINGNVKPSAL